MNLTFANPLGLWALLGLPLIVAIHFLQRRSQRRTITTLFLLQQMHRESESGRRIERWRSSRPFWLQILMVLLLAWLLSQPRWLKTESMQRLAIVLDSSASMQAFQEPTTKMVQRLLDRLIDPTVAAEISLVSSDPEAPAFYHGASRAAALDSLKQWRPWLGVHDFSSALRSSRALVGPKGVVLLLTDQPLDQPLPFEAEWVSIGESIANVGWVGVNVEQKDGQWLWRAMVKNHGTTTEERQWQVEAGGSTSPPAALRLAPGELRTLSGPFPPGQTPHLLLRLSTDAFPLDDRLPLVRPAMKVLAIYKASRQSAALNELFDRFPNVQETASIGTSDLAVGLAHSEVILPEQRHACLFLPAAKADAPYLKGGIVAEANQPLMEGLNWQGLLVRQNGIVPRLPQDRVLLWQGDRPLICLRQMPAGGQQLICQFDLETSNARRLPALAVLLHRFLENIRRYKLAPESANLDLREKLDLALLQTDDAPDLTLTTWSEDGQSHAVTIPRRQSQLQRAPAQPGRFEIKQGERLVLTGAAHFADIREADFKKASTYEELDKISVKQTETLHEADPNWRLWLMALLILLLGSWWAPRALDSNRKEAAVA